MSTTDVAIVYYHKLYVGKIYYFNAIIHASLNSGQLLPCPSYGVLLMSMVGAEEQKAGASKITFSLLTDQF